MKPEKRENVLTGLVGAFLGSLIGVACIVGIGQLGYVASISGVVMAVCAIKGYSLLGGTMSRKGTVISCVLTVIMTYFGNRLDFAVTVARAAEVDVFTAFQAMGELLEAGYINGAAYWGNLIMLYLFTLLGAVPTLISASRRATPVSIPQGHTSGEAEAPSAEEAGNSPTQLYPFGGLSWTLRLRLSVSLPLLLPVFVVVAVLFVLYSRSGDSLNSSIPAIAALLGATVGMLASAVWMLARLSAFQSLQFVFVRIDGELWRVDLAKLNGIEPYRFTTKTGALRALRWDILTEEEQQRAQSAIERAIRSIRAGEIMPDSLLRQFVLYLPDTRLEKEDKWTWKISYALNTEAGTRKKMTIGKVYPGLVPAPGTTAPEGPVPARWSGVFLCLALTLLLALVGWGIGLSLSGQPASSKNDTSIPAVSPESFTFYEQNGVKFQIDSTFQDMDGSGEFMDPDTGTIYMIGVLPEADPETAMDVLLGPIGDTRMMDTFQDFSFAYPSEEEDLVDLQAEDGTIYQHNLLTIHFTDGQAFHSAVSLSDSGTLIQVLAIQSSLDEEEQVMGMIRYLLTTLTATGAEGQEEFSL